MTSARSCGYLRGSTRTSITTTARTLYDELLFILMQYKNLGVGLP